MRWIVFFMGVFWAVGVASAAEVTLAWDANSEKDLVGYKLYYTGPEIAGKKSPVWLRSTPKNPQMKLEGLQNGEYCFTVTAYNNAGMESGKSNKVCVRPPKAPVLYFAQ